MYRMVVNTRGLLPTDIGHIGILILRIHQYHAGIFRQCSLGLSAYEAAIQSIEIYDRVGFAFIPFECQPALIAMISDFMKALDGVDVVIVYARQEDGIRFAVRSDEKRVNVGVLLKEMLHGIGDGGGHPAMAGGCISKEIAERLGDTLHETVKRRFMQGIQEMRDGKSIEMRNV